jgi:hypothetical protein
LEQQEEEMMKIRRCTHTGRPCGGKEFVDEVCHLTNRDLTLKKRGRKPKEKVLDPRQGDLFDE